MQKHRVWYDRFWKKRRNRTLCLLSDVRMYSWISLEMRALYTSNTHMYIHIVVADREEVRAARD